MAKVPIVQGLLTIPLEPVEKVRMKGTKCLKCGEVFMGRRAGCENCGSVDLTDIVLSNRGKLYNFTIIENPPPGYKGPNNPFIAYGEGLVELPEGCRILSPLTVNKPEQIKIGMPLELVVHKLYEDASGNEVMAYKFKPI